LLNLLFLFILFVPLLFEPFYSIFIYFNGWVSQSCPSLVPGKNEPAVCVWLGWQGYSTIVVMREIKEKRRVGVGIEISGI